MTGAGAFRGGAPHVLVVVEVTRSRPGREAYHSYVDVLNSRIVREAGSLGFAVTRIAAGDVSAEALRLATRDASAIVIAGGEDIAPHRYGAAPGYPAESSHNDRADEGQLELVRHAVATGTPLLGICRGHQIINVALGGTLVQHIDDSPIHVNTGVPITEVMAGHPVALGSGSLLAEHLGQTTVSVQSAHHQAVRRAGEGLLVVGRAPDGTVEAVEHSRAPIVGVQWHPEDLSAPEGQLLALLELLRESVDASPAAASARVGDYRYRDTRVSAVAA